MRTEQHCGRNKVSRLSRQCCVAESYRIIQNSMWVYIYTYLHLVCADKIEIQGCTSSSQQAPENSCEMAFDTDINADSTEWATNNEGVGAWIQLNFKQGYEIERLEIRHRSQPTAMRFKDIILEFSNGESHEYTLNDDSMILNQVVFAKLVVSEYLRITTTSTYGTHDNGYSDIKVFGCILGNGSLQIYN